MERTWAQLVRWAVNVSLMSLLGASLTAAARGDTVSDMTSQTVATTPTDRTRTTLGIGEAVTCQVNPVPSGNGGCNGGQDTSEDDTIGSYTWTKTGTEAANASFSTLTGHSTVLTAGLSPGNVTVQVTVTLQNSNTGATGQVEKTLGFQLQAPSSATFVSNGDAPIWTHWTSGTKILAARTLYKVTIQPTTVSFCGVAMRENFGSGQTATWPDGSQWQGPTGTVGPMYPNAANQCPDEQDGCPCNSSHLLNGTQWNNFSVSFSIPYEYLNADEDWAPFVGSYAATATRNYFQANLTTQVGVGGVPGGAQGPWQQ